MTFSIKFIWFQLKQKEDHSQVHIATGISEMEKHNLHTILNEFKELFSNIPGETDIITHSIQLTSLDAVSVRP